MFHAASARDTNSGNIGGSTLISACHNPIPTNGFQHMKVYLFLGSLTIWHSVNLKMKGIHCEDTPKGALVHINWTWGGGIKNTKLG